MIEVSKEIKDAVVDLEEQGKVEYNSRRACSLINRNFNLGCLNRACNSQQTQRGYQFMTMVEEMIRNKEVTSSGLLICEGEESMGKRATRSCGNSTKYTIKLVYCEI